MAFPDRQENQVEAALINHRVELSITYNLDPLFNRINRDANRRIRHGRISRGPKVTKLRTLWRKIRP